MTLSSLLSENVRVNLEALSSTSTGSQTVQDHIKDVVNTSVKNCIAHLPVLEQLSKKKGTTLAVSKLDLLCISLRLRHGIRFVDIVRQEAFRDSVINSLNSIVQALVIAFGVSSSDYSLTDESTAGNHAVFYYHFEDPSTTKAVLLVTGDAWKSSFAEHLESSLVLTGVFPKTLLKHATKFAKIASKMMLTAISSPVPSECHHDDNVKSLIDLSFHNNAIMKDFQDVIARANVIGAQISDIDVTDVTSNMISSVTTYLTALDIICVLVLRPLQLSPSGSNEEEEEEEEDVEDGEETSYVAAAAAAAAAKKKEKKKANKKKTKKKKKNKNNASLSSSSSVSSVSSSSSSSNHNVKRSKNSK
jgi:hypothetical protein